MIIEIKPSTERDPGPYEAGRRCACGAILSRSNPGPNCAPCSGGEWTTGDMLAEIADLPAARRARVFDAFGDLAA